MWEKPMLLLSKFCYFFKIMFVVGHLIMRQLKMNGTSPKQSICKGQVHYYDYCLYDRHFLIIVIITSGTENVIFFIFVMHITAISIDL